MKEDLRNVTETLTRSLKKSATLFEIIPQEGILIWLFSTACTSIFQISAYGGFRPAKSAPISPDCRIFRFIGTQLRVRHRFCCVRWICPDPMRDTLAEIVRMAAKNCIMNTTCGCCATACNSGGAFIKTIGLTSIIVQASADTRSGAWQDWSRTVFSIMNPRRILKKRPNDSR